MIEATLNDPAQASAAEAGALVATLFPAAGEYAITQPNGAAITVDFSHGGDTAGDPGEILRTCFPAAGVYRIGTRAEILKALRFAPSKPFDEWFFERLVREAEGGFTSVRTLYRRVLGDFFVTHLGRHADDSTLQQFEALLFDLRQALRWHVAAPIAPEIRTRLEGLGFTPRDVVDFPGIAYRLGMMESAIKDGRSRPTWQELLAIAERAPVLHSDQVAMTVARERAGQYLAPVLTKAGTEAHARLLERERDLLRTMTPEALAKETSARTFARELYAKIEGETTIARDWDRVARTELQEARLRGAFAGERRARAWTAETLLYRTLGPNPCSACLKLYKNPDGTPRLYSMAQVEREDALGLNRGPWREFHARVGATHPQCLCAPWLTWNPALAGFFREQAVKKWAALMRDRGLADAA